MYSIYIVSEHNKSQSIKLHNYYVDNTLDLEHGYQHKILEWAYNIWLHFIPTKAGKRHNLVRT